MTFILKAETVPTEVLPFIFYWKDGSFTKSSGSSVAGAFKAAGFGLGAMKGLDFYSTSSVQEYIWEGGKGWVRMQSLLESLVDLPAMHAFCKRLASTVTDAAAVPYVAKVRKLMLEGETFSYIAQQEVVSHTVTPDNFRKAFIEACAAALLELDPDQKENAKLYLDRISEALDENV